MNDQGEQLGEFAHVDHDRERRQGLAEVIYGEGKTAEETAAIAKSIVERSGRLLVTRASAAQWEAVQSVVPAATYAERARVIWVAPEPSRVAQHLVGARVAVVAAGTSDLPVAEEAVLTLRVAGVGTISRVYDVGVSGIHRLLSRSKEFDSADVVLVCAGMEGALPSVVAGLVKMPVIAVPTSVGYGASFHGLAALLGMLNSCASGMTVVNIDNGFGGAMAAIRMLTLLRPNPER